MAKDFGFTPDTAQRVIDATRAHERTGVSTVGRPAERPVSQPVRMWVQLTTATALNATQFKYSFIRVIPDANAASGFSYDPDTVGTDCVFDPNMLLDGVNGGATGKDRVVQIELVGYKAPDDPIDPLGPIYWIVGSGGGTGDSGPWVHDHRNNNPENGGFAFSVYHPGTQLPQVNFAE